MREADVMHGLPKDEMASDGPDDLSYSSEEETDKEQGRECGEKKSEGESDDEDVDRDSRTIMEELESGDGQRTQASEGITENDGLTEEAKVNMQHNADEQRDKLKTEDREEETTYFQMSMADHSELKRAGEDRETGADKSYPPRAPEREQGPEGGGEQTDLGQGHG